ncbi:gamma-glutamyl-gamma-aminobutyrate hydrolase family protein [Photobacterium sagamiensis]|uniref:glutamine amidotransferase-related protein n=1 Tax=Photobacterium sagamiensis TaxID=2910241 RepID=UPI003D10F48B
MKLGVLLCDDVRPELQIRHHNYPEMFAAILLKADPELELFYYRVMAGHYPDTIDECDGYISTGSKYSVYDNDEWIKNFERFVRKLFQHNKPFVGVCFGHQMIAQALSGSVMKSPNGWGIGINTWQLLAHESWMVRSSINTDDSINKKPSIVPHSSLSPYVSKTNNLERFSLAVSHQDQVVSLPANTTVLAGSAFCPNAMIKVGDHFLGIQGHPEFTREYSHDLMEIRQGDIPANAIEVGMASLEQPLDSDEVTRWMLNFIKVNLPCSD